MRLKETRPKLISAAKRKWGENIEILRILVVLR